MMEGGCANERISIALNTLKSDLMEMRNQDVELMKQLIKINDTISELANRKPRAKVCRNASLNSRLDCKGCRRAIKKNPLIRQRSDPVFFKSTTPQSSFEDITSSSESMSIAEESESDMDLIAGSTMSLPAASLTRTDSFSYMRSLPGETSVVDDKTYHGILMKNIKLWKYSRGDLSTSQSESEEES